jgi:uncharacterized repeat protein (TIGR01451 family)
VADVAIEKTGPATLQSGTQIQWSLKVRDNGPSTAHNVTVEDPLPAGVTLTGATPSQGEACQETAGTLTCDLGTIVNGAQAEITIVANVTLASGTLENTAHVTATEPDSNVANNSSTAITTVTPVPAKAIAPEENSGNVDASNASKSRTHVHLRKLVNRKVAVSGERLHYQLLVTDVGSQMAHSLVVCDAIPAQTTVVKLGGGHLSSGHVCFWLTSLKPGHTRSYDLVLRVDTGAHGRIVNRAQVRGANFATERAHAITRLKSNVAPRRESGVTG